MAGTPPIPPAVSKKYNLLCGENTFSSPASVNPNDARKLQSLIPSLSGALEREHPSTFFALTTLPGKIGFFHQFGRNNGAATTLFQFCATVSTLFRLSGNIWVPVTQVGNLSGFPTAVNIDNVMQLDDSGNGRVWIFDGTNWVRGGLPIPLHSPKFTAQAVPPSITVISISRSNNLVTAIIASNPGYSVGMGVTQTGTADPSFDGTFQLTNVNAFGTSVSWQQFDQPDGSSSGGTITAPGVTIVANRFYWTTFVDATPGRRQHESSSSHISTGTGAQSAKTFKVQQRFGTISTADGVNFVGSGTDFSQDDVGMVVYAGTNTVSFGIISAVTDASHLAVDPLALPYRSNVIPAGSTFVIAPIRATHWNVYASASETDRVGNLLASLTVTNTFLIDDSPMIGTNGSQFSSVNRPLLNDPPPASIMSEVHNNRIYRRVETNPNFFSRTGLEEIQAQQAGSPYECVPGADPNTVSPAIINEESFPDQSIAIRGFRSHGDALYIGSEKDIIPWYGRSNSDFSFSNDYAFKVGLAGQRAWVSTPFGLAFISFDFKVYLYPSQYSFNVDSTTALIELGRPKRDEFEKMDSTDFQNAHLIFYNWGRRNWLVASFKRRDGTYATWGFDFEVKGWFQFQRGYTAVYVFELVSGLKVLVGAGVDNKTYVIDDLTGTFPITGTFPVGYVRFLIDFGLPDTYFIIHEIGHERSRKDMPIDVTIWLDPLDPENPGAGIPWPVSETAIGGNYSSKNTDGSTCQRVLVEFAIAASSVNGKFNGFTVEAAQLPRDPSNP